MAGISGAVRMFSVGGRLALAFGCLASWRVHQVNFLGNYIRLIIALIPRAAARTARPDGVQSSTFDPERRRRRRRLCRRHCSVGKSRLQLDR